VLLRSQLAEWQIDGEVAHTAEVLLSELMSNAVRHARTPSGRQIGVRVAQYYGRLRVEVADASSARPKPKEAATDEEAGRGLAIVGALATRWGCCPRRHASARRSGRKSNSRPSPLNRGA
jgi:anti-sigma regulatory factor (Ser/Thr protein kinase)